MRGPVLHRARFPASLTQLGVLLRKVPLFY